MKTLYIAEKKSLADVVAGHLWPNREYTNKGLYYEDNSNIVTWAAGHILGFAEPEAYGEEYKAWSNFPIYPKTWILLENSDKGKKKLLANIKNLLPKADTVVNVGDPDREGQLLIDEILYYFGYKGNVKRLLLHGLDKTNVDRDFKHIVDNKTMHNLYLAGLCREQADWLVGMNLTRSYSVASRPYGYMQAMRIGRVMIPTLGLVVKRERDILNFKSKDFFEFYGLFNKDDITFKAKLVPDDSIATDEEDRIIDRKGLDTLAYSLKGEKGTILEAQEKEETKKPPLPHSLDTLQVAANAKFKYSPSEVLDAVESMYLKKVVTYPRSDCNYLPEAQFQDAPDILSNLAKNGFKPALKANRGIKSSCWNDKKVTAHTAIIPTTVTPSGLSEVEQNVYDMIALNYCLQFYEPCKSKKITFTIKVKDSTFKGSGSKVISPGFTTILKEDKKTADDDNALLPSLTKGDQVDSKSYEIKAGTTKPPKRFTEGTLLKAMSTVWKYIDPKSPNREKLKEVKGIGTPATRNQIIEKLLDTKNKGHDVSAYLKKSKNYLVPTEFGFFVYDNIDSTLNSPETTAVMEYALTAIEEGKLSPEQYIDSVKEMIESNFKYAENHKFPVASDTVECPVCHKDRLYRIKTKDGNYLFVCHNRECVHPKTGKRIYYVANKNKPVVALCPKCGLPAIHHDGKFGEYWTCDGCGSKLVVDIKKGTCEMQKPKSSNHKVTDILCPVCKKGHLIRGETAKGDIYYMCENKCSAPGDDSKYPIFYNEFKGKPNIQYCPNDKSHVLVAKRGKYGPYWHCYTCNANFKDDYGKPIQTGGGKSRVRTKK